MCLMITRHSCVLMRVKMLALQVDAQFEVSESPTTDNGLFPTRPQLLVRAQKRSILENCTRKSWAVFRGSNPCAARGGGSESHTVRHTGVESVAAKDIRITAGSRNAVREGGAKARCR